MTCPHRGRVKHFGIYLVKRQQRGRLGFIKSKKWAKVVYGWTLGQIIWPSIFKWSFVCPRIFNWKKYEKVFEYGKRYVAENVFFFITMLWLIMSPLSLIIAEWCKWMWNTIDFNPKTTTSSRCYRFKIDESSNTRKIQNKLCAQKPEKGRETSR